MQAAGWQVGAPDAADRLTMLTVLLVGNLGAAVVGGAVMGLVLTRSRSGVGVSPAAPLPS